MGVFLSIVIPIYNEELRIGKTLEKIINYFSNRNFSYELILVNDGSNDETRDILEKFKISSDNNFENCKLLILNNKINRGKGYSVRKGILSSNGKYVLFTDADMSIPIEEFEKLFSCLRNGFNIAIASRGLKDSILIVRPSRIREYMGKFFNFLVRKVAKINYTDTQCGFKCFDRKAVDLIFPYLKINDFSFDVEILYLAKKLNLKVKEIPVQLINYKGSKVSIIKDSIKMLLGLVRIMKMHSNFDGKVNQ